MATFVNLEALNNDARQSAQGEICGGQSHFKPSSDTRTARNLIAIKATEPIVLHSAAVNRRRNNVRKGSKLSVRIATRSIVCRVNGYTDAASAEDAITRSI